MPTFCWVKQWCLVPHIPVVKSSMLNITLMFLDFRLSGQLGPFPKDSWFWQRKCGRQATHRRVLCQKLSIAHAVTLRHHYGLKKEQEKCLYLLICIFRKLAGFIFEFLFFCFWTFSSIMAVSWIANIYLKI